MEGGAPKALGFEGQQGLSAGAPQDYTKQPPLWKGAHKASHALGPGTKQWLHRSPGQTHLPLLEGLLRLRWWGPQPGEGQGAEKQAERPVPYSKPSPALRDGP